MVMGFRFFVLLGEKAEAVFRAPLQEFCLVCLDRAVDLTLPKWGMLYVGMRLLLPMQMQP